MAGKLFSQIEMPEKRGEAFAEQKPARDVPDLAGC
jgi:hypothetical protein